MMQRTDRTDFLKLMAGLGTLYSKPINEALVEIYWRALQHFTLADIQRALQTHVKNPDAGQFMPKPADVIRYLEGNSEAKALQAWSTVATAIRQIGQYDSVEFDDCIIHAVIRDMGGWIALCRVSEKELPFMAKEFEKRYTAFLLNPPLSYPAVLLGRLEQQKPVRIGHSLSLSLKETTT